MKRRVTFTFLLFLILFIISSCVASKSEAKEEFSQYFNGKDEIIINYDNWLYYENLEIDVAKIVNEENIFGPFISNDKIIFAASSGNFTSRFRIYEMDMTCENPRVIFEKKGYKTYPWAVYGGNGYYYILHNTKNGLLKAFNCIDRYSIFDNTYENVENGAQCALENYLPTYESNYNIEMIEKNSQHRGMFVITNEETGEKRTIDDLFLMDTIYYESMIKFGYKVMRYDIIDDHILLTYYINAEGSFDYSHLVYEYYFDSNTIEYKLLAFPVNNHFVTYLYIE